jgi:hypothetical protein
VDDAIDPVTVDLLRAQIKAKLLAIMERFPMSSKRNNYPPLLEYLLVGVLDAILEFFAF